MTEPRKRRRRKLVLTSMVGLLAIGAVAAWLQWTSIRCAYYAYRMESVPEGERHVWADRLVEIGEPAVPKLLACFRKDDPALCTVACESLEKLLAGWGPKDPRCGGLADRYFELHPTFSPAGQIAALQLLPAILATGVAEVNARARIFVSAALKDKTPELRFLAIAAAMRGEMNLLPAVVPLLDDADPRIRRKAMLAVGSIKENSSEQPVITSDELLKWLHDPDPEVRQTCVSILKSRDLRDVDIRLGRMLANPDPADRLNLLLDLPEEENLDLAVWLQRLSNDTDSAVRAGAARVAAEHRVEFAERLEEMSRQDPDETVRKIAAYYVRIRRNP